MKPLTVDEARRKAHAFAQAIERRTVQMGVFGAFGLYDEQMRREFYGCQIRRWLELVLDAACRRLEQRVWDVGGGRCRSIYV